MITPYGTLYIICNTYQYIVISKKDAEKVQFIPISAFCENFILVGYID